ncbi:hypothetical protein [uncultured Sphingomonas sp.]|uniref:hypothetical protein n=1 Tax=uncultured Sphingomonas sp. TaxID=158754 RepID=UPI0035C990F9
MVTIPLIAAALLAGAQTTPPQTQPAAPAAGTAAATPTVEAAVSDQAGMPVGTITQINGNIVVIDTGTIKAGVPLAAVGPGPSGGLITTVTKVQLEAAAAQNAAQLKALLVAGTSVHASDETTAVGTIKTADAQFVTLTTPKGDVRFPAGAFAARPSGLIVSMTPDQFNAAVAQSLGASAK